MSRLVVKKLEGNREVFTEKFIFSLDTVLARIFFSICSFRLFFMSWSKTRVKDFNKLNFKLIFELLIYKN